MLAMSILFGTLLLGPTLEANLVQDAGIGLPYEPLINGITYGPNNPLCFTNCRRGEVCTIKNKNAYCKPYCGDGIIVGAEVGSKRCDDGNTISKDGCTNCVIDKMYYCTKEPSVCKFSCGDGKLDTEVGESCDDGNLTPGDGCSGICVVNPGWGCTNQANVKSVCTPTCGDAKRVGDEMNGRRCDDGNQKNGDGCDSTCNIENLYKCTGTPSTCQLMCPNGKLNLAVGQFCDDGNQVDTDGCSNKCTVNNGWNCTSRDGTLSICAKK